MTAAVLAALASVFTMGFAIQRGGTCTVAAVDEVLHQRRAQRLLALLEASLWVAGTLALAQWAGLRGSSPPAGQAVGPWTLIGAALLGLGAWLNGACVFGAVARLGSGEWAYLATPLGFYAGCLSVMTLFHRPAGGAIAAPAAWPTAAPALALLFGAFALWRLAPGGLRVLRGPGHVQELMQARRRARVQALHQRVWAPHAATIVIGLCFVVSGLAAGRWAYTDVLADLARMMTTIHGPGGLLLPVLLLLVLYGGALAGGRSAGRWRPTRVTAAQLLRCLGGGALMGWGSLLIPGSNDGLILVGMPLLRPYAWLAFGTMFATIAAAMRLQQAVTQHLKRRHIATIAGRPEAP